MAGKNGLPWTQRYRIHKRDNFKCAYCPFTGHTWETYRYLSTDHILRVADGGTDDDSNLVTACIACNVLRNRTTFITFEEKALAIAEKLEEYRTFFEEKVRPFIRGNPDPPALVSGAVLQMLIDAPEGIAPVSVAGDVVTEEHADRPMATDAHGN